MFRPISQRTPRTLLTRRAVLCAAVAAMLHAGTGCQQRSDRPSAPGVISPDPNGANDVHAADGSRNDRRPQWPFWPVAMRVHPLTRLTNTGPGGTAIIECRLEFTDAEGQTSKAIGQLTLQVYPDSFAPTGRGALETWNQDLRDLEINRRQYDDITRTYLFRLEVSQPLPAGCEVRAFFLSTDGRRLNAEMRLRQ